MSSLDKKRVEAGITASWQEGCFWVSLGGIATDGEWLNNDQLVPVLPNLTQVPGAIEPSPGGNEIRVLNATIGPDPHPDKHRGACAWIRDFALLPADADDDGKYFGDLFALVLLQVSGAGYRTATLKPLNCNRNHILAFNTIASSYQDERPDKEVAERRDEALVMMERNESIAVILQGNGRGPRARVFIVYFDGHEVSVVPVGE